MKASRWQRVGMLGGAFDPPHLAHQALAQTAIDQLQLDCLLVIPTGHAWHKERPLTGAKHRIAMCELAFSGLGLGSADMGSVRIDAREIERAGPTYTVDTLRELRGEFPQAQLFLIMGADQARALHRWYQAKDLPALATICVAQRSIDAPASEPANDDLPNTPEGVSRAAGAHQKGLAPLPDVLGVPDVPDVPVLSGLRPQDITWLSMPESLLSATQVRQQVALHRNVASLVCPAVARYIDQHQLYQAA